MSLSWDQWLPVKCHAVTMGGCTERQLIFVGTYAEIAAMLQPETLIRKGSRSEGVHLEEPTSGGKHLVANIPRKCRCKDGELHISQVSSSSSHTLLYSTSIPGVPF